MKKNICLLICLMLLIVSCDLVYAAEPDEKILNYDTVSGNDMPGAVDDSISFDAPENLDFMLDPLQLRERGQIYSEDFYFVNNDGRTIRVDLTDIKCILSEGVEAVGAEDSEDIISSDEKLIHLQLLLETGETITVTETSGQYSFALKPGEKFGFKITGSMSEDPNQFWDTGDVMISLNYSVDFAGE